MRGGRDLPAMVAATTFRQDLSYRLNVIPLQMPPLRERLADMLPLAEHFLARVAQAAGTARKQLATDAQGLLVSFGWPGNVRELANAIERASALAPAALLTREDFAFLFVSGAHTADAIPASLGLSHGEAGSTPDDA